MWGWEYRMISIQPCDDSYNGPTLISALSLFKTELKRINAIQKKSKLMQPADEIYSFNNFE